MPGFTPGARLQPPGTATVWFAYCRSPRSGVTIPRLQHLLNDSMTIQHASFFFDQQICTEPLNNDAQTACWLLLVRLYPRLQSFALGRGVSVLSLMFRQFVLYRWQTSIMIWMQSWVRGRLLGLTCFKTTEYSCEYCSFTGRIEMARAFPRLRSAGRIRKPTYHYIWRYQPVYTTKTQTCTSKALIDITFLGYVHDAA